MRSNKIKELTCAEMEELIAKNLSYELSARGKSAYTFHLEHCPECRNTVLMMESLPQRLQEMEEISLKPRPDIQQNLRKRLKEKSPRPKNRRGVSLKNLGEVLRFRVPIYQAVLAMALFLVILYADHFTIPNDRPVTQMASPAQLADTTEILDTLGTAIPEKVGRNIQEDSLLARFMMSIM
jgi:hypothetical protein